MTDDEYDHQLDNVTNYITEKNQTVLLETASLLIITIVYGTIVNKHNATNCKLHF